MAAVRFGVDFLIGGLSAAISKTVVAPIENAKLILQCQACLPFIKPEERYTGTTDCLYRVTKEHGILTLFRGNLVNVLRYFPAQFLNFALREVIINIVPMISSNNYMIRISYLVATGTLAGSILLLFLYPLDLVRTILAVDIGKQRMFTGNFDCLSSILKSDGIFGLYRGFLVSVLGIITYRASYFMLFDLTKALMPNLTGFQRTLANFVVAQSVTIAAGLLTYPIDTVRRRLMVQSALPVDLRQYNGTIDCVIKMAKNEGLGAFYAGVFSNALRGSLGATVIILYDLLFPALKQR